MTGDFTLTLPVMLAVAIATATSRALSYGTIYTTKLLRRGHDIDRAAPWRAFGDLKAADVMRPLREPLAVAAGPDGNSSAHPDLASLAGTVTHRGDPQAIFASESLTQTLRQLESYGRDGLPVLSTDGRQVQGWITSASVLHTVAREIGGHPQTRATPGNGETARTRPPSACEPPNPLPGYQILEITIQDGSPAAGQALGAITWPAGTFPVSVLHDHALHDPNPGLILAPGDHINLLAHATQPPVPPRPPAQTLPHADGHPPTGPARGKTPGPRRDFT